MGDSFDVDNAPLMPYILRLQNTPPHSGTWQLSNSRPSTSCFPTSSYLHQNAASLAWAVMALLTPGYGLVLPFLFLFTIPIAILAALTTTLAFSILLFRVILVYIELALTVIPQYLLGFNLATRSVPPSATGRGRRGTRRRNSGGAVSGSITPIGGVASTQSTRHVRDYEGVGGWRLGPPSDDDDLWSKFNSRLELPADRGRRHHRSLTAGSFSVDARQRRTFSTEMMMNTAKARTPPAVSFDGFFPPTPPSPGALRRTSSAISSGSSKESSSLSLKQR